MFQESVKVLKTLARSMVWLYTSKETGHSKTSLCHLRTKMKWPTRVVSSTVIVVERLNAMKNM